MIKASDRFIRPLLCVALLLAQFSCAHSSKETSIESNNSHYIAASTQIEYPEICEPATDPGHQYVSRPRLLEDDAPQEFLDLTLEQAMALGFQNSELLKSAGAIVLRSPDTLSSQYDVALMETDPRYSVAAALSEFDTSFAASAFYQKNDRALNNVFFGGGTRLLQQQAFNFQSQLSKRTAVGTVFSFRHNFDYDANNAPGNAFPGAWNTMLEAEFRQPLLQGFGTDYSRIVGASSTPGVYNGVLIARTRTDINLADFELTVRDAVSEIENAYWDLVFAYRNFESKKVARDSALDVWRRVNALKELGRLGGEADKEAQAREQYLAFEEQLQNALTGRLVEGTTVQSGSSGGSFRGGAGVYVAERRLRYLIGLPTTDDRLLRPVDEPVSAPINMPWDYCVTQAMASRAELRRQQWTIKQRELELVASEQFLLPQLDVVGLQRWRGFGRTLLNSSSNGTAEYNNAWRNLTGGDFQEWEVGVEMNMPLGYRRGHAAVRHAEFQLAKARATLKEQERRILHDLSNAYADLDRAYHIMQTAGERRIAAREQQLATMAAFDNDQASLNLVLEAQRRQAAAETHAHETMLDYTVALKNLHFEQGQLLEYCGITLSEGPWSPEDHQDAQEKLDLHKPYRDRWVMPEQTDILTVGSKHSRTQPIVGVGSPIQLEEEPQLLPTEPTPLEDLPDLETPLVPMPKASSKPIETSEIRVPQVAPAPKADSLIGKGSTPIDFVTGAGSKLPE